jgi:cytochrome c oxidase assembly protein subunit 11
VSQAAISTRAQQRTAWLAAAGALAMLGLGFAAVPLYRAFCQATGYGGTPARASEIEASGVKALTGKTMSIRFDANIEPSLKWRFAPEQTTQEVTIGARSLAFFTAENLTDKPITGQATYNIEPEEAASYFTKVQCFCFNQQTLQPHQKVRMPVVYYVDPKVLADKNLKGLEQITLSYTFHPLPGERGGS